MRICTSTHVKQQQRAEEGMQMAENKNGRIRAKPELEMIDDDKL